MERLNINLVISVGEKRINNVPSSTYASFAIALNIKSMIVPIRMWFKFCSGKNHTMPKCGFYD
jgi:hypothetical protein